VLRASPFCIDTDFIIQSDFNTGELTTCVNKNATIVDFQRITISIGELAYLVTMKSVSALAIVGRICLLILQTLQALADSLKQARSSISAAKITWDPIPRFGEQKSSNALVQDYLWPVSITCTHFRFGILMLNVQALSAFFRPGDIIIGETVTSAFGLRDSRLPSGVVMFDQTVFGSVGYATGAIVGVAQAIKESGAKWKRPVLVTGEGSMHLTIQAIGDILRFDLKPVM